MDRRRFLGWTVLGAAGAALPRCGPWTGRGKEERPNLVVIMADEHAGDVAGCYGDPVARTPTMDRLAAEGVLFESCYAPSPLCAPSRLSFLANRYVSGIGAWSNTSWLPSDEYPTLASLLGRAGYAPLLAGKMHLDRTRRYGFRELFAGRFNRREKTGLVERLDPENVPISRRQWRRRAGRLSPVATSEVMDWDLQLTEEASRFLLERQRGEGPFLLAAGYYAPHYPLEVPEEYARHFAGRVPPPVLPEGYVESLPTNYRVFRRQGGMDALDAERVRIARELYWARVEWLDHQIGRLLEALDRSEVAENTVVVYTADHGEMRGEHGLWWKNCMFEAAVRVPLIVRWPERWAGGQRRAGACSLLDLGRTLVDLVGAEAPADWKGRSLLPWMDDPTTTWPDTAVSEYYGAEVASGFAMIRAGRHKYVYHTRVDDRLAPERELYDLESDPGELENLAGRPELAVRAEELHAALVDELGEDPEESEARCRAETARGYARAYSSSSV